MEVAKQINAKKQKIMANAWATVGTVQNHG